MNDSCFIAVLDSAKYLQNIADTFLLSDNHKFSTTTIFNMPEGFARIFVPAIITLIVFILGQLIVWYRNQRSIQNETKNYKKIVLCWADLIRVPIERQIDELNELADRIRSSDVLHPEGFYMNKMLADKVDSISIDRFISTFMINTKAMCNENLNDKMTFNLVSQFNYLVQMEKTIIDTYNAYVKESQDIMDNWNMGFNKLTKCIDEWFVRIDAKHEYFGLKQRVVFISMSWKRSIVGESSTMVNSMENFITPLTEITTEVLNQNVNNEFAYQISETLQSLRFIDYRWRTNNGAYVLVFNKMGNYIKTSLDSINEAKKYFEVNTKTKNVFEIGKY